jgi:probable HAF family extracellular repeat protein
MQSVIQNAIWWVRAIAGRSRLARSVALAGSVSACLIGAPAAAAAASYTITDLGSLGYGVTKGVAINASGQVTGYSYLSKEIQIPCPPQQYGQPKKCFEAPYHAFVWSNGKMTDLGTLGGNFSAGSAINRSGEVVGWTTNKAGYSEPFLWNGQTMTALSGIAPAGINDSGQIVGNCGPDPATGSFDQPCVLTNGKFTTLVGPPNLPDCSAGAINNNDQVLGGCADASGDEAAVVWTNGTPTVLPTLGGPTIAANAINNLGQVAGYAQTSTYAQHGFLWSNGTMTDLGNNFFAAAINDNGVIVGGSEIYGGLTLEDLNTLIPAGSPYNIMYATAINNKGQIVANAYDTATNQNHALVLAPN